MRILFLSDIHGVPSALVRAIPADRLLVESDATAANAAEVPSVRGVAAKLAALRGLPADALETLLEENAARFSSFV